MLLQSIAKTSPVTLFPEFPVAKATKHGVEAPVVGGFVVLSAIDRF